MPEEHNKSLDIFGVKGVADSTKIITEAGVKCLTVFLSDLCRPGLQEFGGWGGDIVRHYRVQSQLKFAKKAKEMIEEREKIEGKLHAPAPVILELLEGASRNDDDDLHRIWVGLLASSCTTDGMDDSNIPFIHLATRLSPTQARLFSWIATNCPKIHDKDGIVQGDHFKPTAEQLFEAAKTTDRGRLDAELSPLFAAGLFHNNFGEKSIVSCLGLSSFGVIFYLRVEGKRGDPKNAFPTTIKDVENHNPGSVWL